MTYTYEIYDSEYGKGFKIYQDGKLIIVQPFKPRVSGFVGMTEEEARAEAEAMISELQKPIPIITTIYIKDLTDAEKQQITDLLTKLNKEYTII
ncbi:MAG: hypothetical protein QW734_03870 [Candidatus Bathyarchaeia archaeon]